MVLITFKFYAKWIKIPVQAEVDEKFGEVIINNESKIGLNLRNKKYKFFYNDYELKLNSSKTLLELGLNKNPIIKIIDLDIEQIIKPSESSNIPILFNFKLLYTLFCSNLLSIGIFVNINKTEIKPIILFNIVT